jgi:hypothetical protein
MILKFSFLGAAYGYYRGGGSVSGAAEIPDIP